MFVFHVSIIRNKLLKVDSYILSSEIYIYLPFSIGTEYLLAVTALWVLGEISTLGPSA